MRYAKKRKWVARRVLFQIRLEVLRFYFTPDHVYPYWYVMEALEMLRDKANFYEAQLEFQQNVFAR
jgi:hypothetical protein